MEVWLAGAAEGSVTLIGGGERSHVQSLSADSNAS